MDTIAGKRTASADPEQFLRHLGKPARWSAPRAAGVADEIAAFVQRQPDITLGEIGVALVGAGFTWSSEGKFDYSPLQVSLIEEIEALIETHGQKARAAELFL